MLMLVATVTTGCIAAQVTLILTTRFLILTGTLGLLYLTLSAVHIRYLLVKMIAINACLVILMNGALKQDNEIL